MRVSFLVVTVFLCMFFGLAVSQNRVAGFENEVSGIALSSDVHYWLGAKPLVSGNNAWSSGDYEFYTYNDDQYETPYYYAFVVSNDTASSSSGWNEPYRSASGGAYQGDNFAVWSYDYYGTNGVICKTSAVVPGFFVNNNAYTVHSMIYGDSYARRFTSSDYLHLLCIGSLNGNITDTLVVELAKEGKYIHEWTYINLSRLGEVDRVVFAMEGSDKSNGMLNTPAYFCLDDFGQEPPENYVAPEMAALSMDPLSAVVQNFDVQPKRTVKKYIRNTTFLISINGYTFNLLGKRVSE